MKRLILHIGTHKTASTSFQRICFGFKNLLAQYNICYPEMEDCPGLNNHAPVAWLFDQRDKSIGQQYLETILNSSQCKECTTTLMSSEDLENILINHSILEQILEVAYKCEFEEVELVIVTRDSRKYLQSIYNQLSKHGAILDYPTITYLADKAGYFSCSLSHFNYHFAIKVMPFINELRRKFPNITIHDYSFEEFTEVYAGKILISNELSKIVAQKIELLDLESLNIISSNESMSELEVEKQYAANILSVSPSQEISRSLKNLIEEIAIHRLERTRQGKDLADFLFKS